MFSMAKPVAILSAIAAVAISISIPTIFGSADRFSSQSMEPHNTSIARSMDLMHQISNPKLRVFSYDPLIIHMESFISARERQYLLELSQPLLSRSTVQFENGTRMYSTERTSSTAYLPADDFVVGTILRRASEFQGYIPVENITIQVTSYKPGQEYRPHFDWFLEPNRTTNRLSTFFAILEAECTICGTHFPNIKVDWKHRSMWCRYFDCTQDTLTSRNVVGSALYWRNLDENGGGRQDTLHAGLPALNGTKVGLNIWTEVEVNRH